MILITRPYSSALQLQSQLNEINLQSQIEPLTTIKIKKIHLKLQQKTIYIIASQQAVKSLAENKLNHFIKHSSLLVIGSSTKILLKKLGAQNILECAPDSTKLLSIIYKKYFNQKLIYLSGTTINQSFVNELRRCVKSLERKVVYQTLSTSKFSSKTMQLFQKRKINFVLFLSQYSVKIFFDLAEKMKAQSLLSNVEFVCLSKRIAHAVREYSDNKCLISAQPNMSSLMKKIRTEFH